MNQFPPPEQRIQSQEWDFSRVLRAEQKACCYYEFARESTYIMETLKNPLPFDCSDPRVEKLRHSPLPPRNDYDCSWLLKEPKWRAQFCEELAERFGALTYARSLERTMDRAFHVGMAPHFLQTLWNEDTMRALDQDTGLETLLVSIDWSNFDDKEIVLQVKKWVKDERPPGMGVHSKKGKKTSVWQMHLRKLGILRLRHNYSSDETLRMPLPRDLSDKFYDQEEVNRYCRGARKALQLLYPFLPEKELPQSWQPFTSA